MSWDPPWRAVRLKPAGLTDPDQIRGAPILLHSGPGLDARTGDVAVAVGLRRSGPLLLARPGLASPAFRKQRRDRARGPLLRAGGEVMPGPSDPLRRRVSGTTVALRLGPSTRATSAPKGEFRP